MQVSFSNTDPADTTRRNEVFAFGEESLETRSRTVGTVGKDVIL